MAKVSTHTKTVTEPRLTTLRRQILDTIVETGYEITDFERDVIKKGINNKYIETFTLHARNGNGLIELEFSFSVDWKRHEIEMKTKPNIELDKAFNSAGVLRTLIEWANLFADEVEEYGLSVDLSYTYLATVDRSVANKELGLTPMTSEDLEWAGEYGEAVFKNKSLPEFRATLKTLK